MNTQDRASYGIDAPAAPVGMLITAIALLGIGIGFAVMGSWVALVPFLLAAGLIVQAISYYYATRKGKFAAWHRILTGLELRGDEQVLDAGCGRGMVLIAAAKFVPNGKVTGVDLWLNRDQSGNQESATMANAKAEGVTDRIELHTADLRELPWKKPKFDLVCSAAALHNIKGTPDRKQAVSEAARVLKPGGRIVIADIAKTGEYIEALREAGMENVQRSNAGLGYNYGLLTPTRIVTATRPETQSKTQSKSSN